MRGGNKLKGQLIISSFKEGNTFHAIRDECSSKVIKNASSDRRSALWEIAHSLVGALLAIQSHHLVLSENKPLNNYHTWKLLVLSETIQLNLVAVSITELQILEQTSVFLNLALNSWNIASFLNFSYHTVLMPFILKASLMFYRL